MRVRQSPNAVRRSRPVGRWEAGLSGTAARVVSAIALSLLRSGLVSVNFLLLCYLDGERIRIEGDLAGIELTLGVTDALGTDRQARDHGGDVHVGASHSLPQAGYSA